MALSRQQMHKWTGCRNESSPLYPLIGVGEGQNFGLSYTRLMTMDLLQYYIAVTEIHHTTCSKHVVVDGKGPVSMQPSHVYFWMCMKHRF